MGQRRMNIRLQCRPNISVAQKLTEALDVHTILHAPCRVGMSEGVKIPIADTAAFQQLPVSVLQCARFHRRVRVGQQIIVSLNALGGRFQQFQHIIGNGYKTHRTAAFRGLHHQMCPGSIAYTGSRALNSQKAGAVVNVAFAQSADLTKSQPRVQHQKDTQPCDVRGLQDLLRQQGYLVIGKYFNLFAAICGQLHIPAGSITMTFLFHHFENCL